MDRYMYRYMYIDMRIDNSFVQTLKLVYRDRWVDSYAHLDQNPRALVLVAAAAACV